MRGLSPNSRRINVKIMIQHIVVLGGGSAGLLAGITLKKRIPQIKVTLLRSPSIGIIGVGEGTTPQVLTHLHGYLDLDPGEFYRQVHPTWKLGIRFLWGTWSFFHYTFSFQYDARVEPLPKRIGFYCTEETPFTNISSALMNQDRVFIRQPNGVPLIGRDAAYHLENELLVSYLEGVATNLGVEITDGTVTEVSQNGEGISGFHLESGETLSGDFFVDCSGFQSLLIGRTFNIPFESYNSALFCDSAIIGGWQRGPDEPIKPYTTSETMDSGWCWQIEHEPRINRGYVFSSRFTSDEDAEKEFRLKNPKVESTRIVRFKSGRYQKAWFKNVVAIGNAAGFVEPLEATALGVICEDTRAVAETLLDCDLHPNLTLQEVYNERSRRVWESIRNFLAVHYRFNKRIDSPFWRECREKVDLGGANQIVEFYQENGPSTIWRQFLTDLVDQFKLEGYLALLIGQQVPHRKEFQPSLEEQERWYRYLDGLKREAQEAFTVEEALAIVRSPNWTWTPGFYR